MCSSDLGDALLVAPVLEPGVEEMHVPLPAGTDWTHVWSGASFVGGTVAHVATPPGRCPVFVRADQAHAFSTVFAALN